MTDIIATDKAPLLCRNNWSVVRFNVAKKSFTYCCDTPNIPFDETLFYELGDRYFTGDHPRLSDRNAKLDAGEWPSDCSRSCEWKESQNIPSMRTNFTYQSDGSFVPDIEYIHADHPDRNTNVIERIEIWPSGLCNLGCFMCNSGDSTIVRKVRGSNDSHTYHDEIHDEWYANMLSFIKKAILSDRSALSIAFLGGEPTMHPEIFDIMETCFEYSKEANPHKHLIMQLHTNGATKPKIVDRLLSIFERGATDPSFPKWHGSISLSYDAAGKTSEVRFLSHKYLPLILENTERYYKNEFVNNLDVSAVLSSFNAPYFDELIREKIDMVHRSPQHSRKFSLKFNMIDHPSWMCHPYMPRKYVADGLQRALALIKNEYRLIESKGLRSYKLEETLEAALNVYPETVTQETAEEFFKKIQEVQQQYRVHYPDFYFEDWFPHIVEYAEDYNMLQYLITK